MSYGETARKNRGNGMIQTKIRDVRVTTPMAFFETRGGLIWSCGFRSGGAMQLRELLIRLLMHDINPLNHNDGSDHGELLKSLDDHGVTPGEIIEEIARRDENPEWVTVFSCEEYVPINEKVDAVIREIKDYRWHIPEMSRKVVSLALDNTRYSEDELIFKFYTKYEAKIADIAESELKKCRSFHDMYGAIMRVRNRFNFMLREHVIEDMTLRLRKTAWKMATMTVKTEDKNGHQDR